MNRDRRRNPSFPGTPPRSPLSGLLRALFGHPSPARFRRRSQARRTNPRG